MAYDKAVDSVKLETGLTEICDAIRESSGTSKKMAFPTEIASTVRSIPKQLPTEEKVVKITTNGNHIVTPTNGKTLSKVTIKTNVPTSGGGGSSDVEIVDFIPPSLPTFKHQTGSFEIWGWGIKDAVPTWNSDYYTFHGNVYANAIDDTDHEMTLTIVNGKAQGIPEMTRGKCIAIVR